VFSVSNPTPGFVLFSNLRRQVGAEVAPISPTSLRAALRCLQDGSVVLTGVDRPTGERDQPIEFFDATAHVSTGYIRIPLRTDCQVVTAAAVYEKGAYHVHVNPRDDAHR
jgi:lauroyl/myristoyl acyltransferase